MSEYGVMCVGFGIQITTLQYIVGVKLSKELTKNRHATPMLTMCSESEIDKVDRKC